MKELEEIAGDPDFWNDMESAQGVLQQTKQLKNKIEGYDSLCTEFEDIMTLIEMGNEMDDDSVVPEVKEMKEKFLEKYEHLRISTLLTGPYDKTMPLLPSTPVRAVQRRATGYPCFTVCTASGWTERDSGLSFWTIWTVTRQA